jgi:hypothetical protein
MAVAEQAVLPVFELELLRSMRDTLHRQNELLSQLKDVLFDLRDELAYLRTHHRSEKP